MKIDSLVYWCLGILLLLALGFLYYRFSIRIDCEDAKFYTKADSYSVNSVIEFGDNTPGADSWEWDFGDGHTDNRQRAFHKYMTSGDYIVRLKINNYCIHEKVVSIGNLRSNPESMPRIISPNVATIGEPVHFQGDKQGGKSWEWNFGESGQLDALSQNPVYTFKSQGRKKVTLIVNGDIQSIASKYIYVAPKEVPDDRKYDVETYEIENINIPKGAPQRDPFNQHLDNLPVKPPGEEKDQFTKKPQKVENISQVKVKQIIRQIASEVKTVDDLMPYVCDDEEVQVIVKGAKHIQSLEEFAANITGKNIRINTLQISKNEKNCFKNISIDYQTKKFGMVWSRDY